MCYANFRNAIIHSVIGVRRLCPQGEPTSKMSEPKILVIKTTSKIKYLYIYLLILNFMKYECNSINAKLNKNII